MSSSSKLISPEEEVLRTSDLQPVGQKYRYQLGLATGVRNPRRGSLKPRIYSWLVRGTGNSVGLGIGNWSGGSVIVLEDQILNCGTWYYLWIEGVRIMFSNIQKVSKNCLVFCVWETPPPRLELGNLTSLWDISASSTPYCLLKLL